MNEAVIETPVIAAKPKKRLGLFIALSIVGAILMKWSYIFLLVGMAPSIVAYIVDTDKNRYTFYTVAALNFSGIFNDLIGVLVQGSNFAAMMERLSDPGVWFIMYGAAALGWGIVWVSPTVVAVALEGVYRGRIAHMESLQKKMEEEWGPEINPQADKNVSPSRP